MRVGFYYHQVPRLPRDHSRNNPYGAILAEGLEQLGVEVTFVDDFSEAFLYRNRGHLDVLHHHWPHHDYYDDDAGIMRQQMRAFVRSMELARELGYKLVWTAHNIYPHNRRHQAIDHECRLEICRLATAIIAHCDVAASNVRTTFQRTRNLFIIPHPHFIGIYPDTVTREQLAPPSACPPLLSPTGFLAASCPTRGWSA